MKRITGLGLLVVLVLAAPAHGEPIRWGYDWMAFPGEVPAGKSKVAFSDEPYRTAAGNTRVVAAALTEVSTADAAHPDTFGARGGFYALVMAVQDLASGQWGAVFFQGQLQGRLSAASTELTNRLLTPAKQTLELGDTLYTVTLDSFTPPSATGAANAGALGALVEVAAIKRETPEPSALVLAGLALAGGAAARRRRRAVRPG